MDSQVHQASPPILDSSSCNTPKNGSTSTAAKWLIRGDSDAFTYPYNIPQRASARGLFFTFLCALGIFGISTASARYVFPRGRATRRENASTNMTSVDPNPGVWAEVSAAAHPVHPLRPYKTQECAGHSKWPVLDGADVVSYFSLEEGQGAMFGFKEHMSVLDGYTFYFISEENKELFEECPSRYMPAWGGFCSWGISNEDWWTKDGLGPDADPNSWLITDDGVLHFFRSHTPKEWFMENIEENVEKGNAIWASWFGEEAQGADGGLSPLNTACFCDVTTCEDDR